MIIKIFIFLIITLNFITFGSFANAKNVDMQNYSKNFASQYNNFFQSLINSHNAFYFEKKGSPPWIFSEQKIEGVNFFEEKLEVKEPIVKVIAPKSSAQKNVFAKIGVAGPILSKTKVINGKSVCENSKDKPRKSHKTSKIHIDAECCLDPDEIPNSNCYYDPVKYGKLIQKNLGIKK